MAPKYLCHSRQRRGHRRLGLRLIVSVRTPHLLDAGEFDFGGRGGGAKILAGRGSVGAANRHTERLTTREKSDQQSKGMRKSHTSERCSHW